MFYPRVEITSGLWVGSLADSSDAAFMRHARIGLVVNCSRDLPFYLPPGVEGERVNVDDSQRYSDAMVRSFGTVLPHIDKTIARGRGVLIHCFAGIQRSSAVAAAYLMYKLGIPAEKAMHAVQRMKPEAFKPRATFRRALQTYYLALSAPPTLQPTRPRP